MSMNYDLFFNREDKSELLEQIRNELTNTFYNIDDRELKYLTELIYEHSCLLFHRIDKDYIIKYINDKNRKFYDSVSEQNIDNFIDATPKSVRYIDFLVKKYDSLMCEKYDNK